MILDILIIALVCTRIMGITVTFDDANLLPINDSSSSSGASTYYTTVTVSSPSKLTPLRKSLRHKGKEGKGKGKSAKTNDDGFFVVASPSKIQNDDAYYFLSKKQKTIKFKSSKNRSDDHFIIATGPSSAAQNDGNYYVIAINGKKSSKNAQGFIAITDPSSSASSILVTRKSAKSTKNMNDDGVTVIFGSPADKLVKRKSSKNKTKRNDDDVIVVSKPSSGIWSKRKSSKNATKRNDDDVIVVGPSSIGTLVRPSPPPATTDDVLVIKRSSSYSGTVKDYDVGNTKTKN